MNTTALHISKYIRSILGILTFFIVLLIATPFILLLLVLSLGHLANFVIERIAPLMMQPVFAILGIRFKVKRHAETTTAPAIFIINHSSTLDLLTVLALGLPRVRFVAKWEFQYNPIFFLLGKLTGQVFIKRHDSQKAVATLQKVYGRIRHNRLSVMMAPEGSRKHSGIIGPFKKGPFRMAMDLNYPIVPIYFEGNQKLCPGGSLLTRSGTVTAHIHTPIDVSGWTLENLETHIADIRQQYLKWARTEHGEAALPVI